MEQIKKVKTNVYTGTIYKVLDGKTVVYVGFTTGDIKAVSLKLQKTTNANLHQYIIEHPTRELKMKVMMVFEYIGIHKLNQIKSKLKKMYGIVDVVRHNINTGEQVEGATDIDVNNPEKNIIIKCKECCVLEPIHQYKKLPMKCDCGSVFNKATRKRHEQTKKHLEWCIRNRYCPFCGVLGCLADLERLKNKEEPPVVLYDYKTGLKLKIDG